MRSPVQRNLHCWTQTFDCWKKSVTACNKKRETKLTIKNNQTLKYALHKKRDHHLKKKTIKIGFEILEGIGTSLSPSPYHGEKTGPKTVTQCNGLKYQNPPPYIKETKTQNGNMLSTKGSFYVGHKTILPFARQKNPRNGAAHFEGQ